MTSQLTKLWKIAESIAKKRQDPSDVFANIGLFLHKSPPHPYDSTPKGSITFASTGGDGVHYGLLRIGDEAMPVVMTVPMNFDNLHMIVGEDIVDFLSLGCRVGYFSLEQLTYDYQQSIDWLESHSDYGEALATDERRLLHVLCEEFGLLPWKGVDKKLQRLNAKYLQAIHHTRDIE
jgi:hypothetical protein